MLSLFNSQQKSRTERLSRVARQLGMSFSEKDNSNLSLLEGFQLFSKGSRKKITNHMHKIDDWMNMEINIFDYQYTISSGKNRRTSRQTVFFINSKDLGLPQILIKPERFFHKIGNYLGLVQDIDFEEYPEFSDHYLVQGDDEEMVRHTLGKQVLKYFTIEKNWHLEGINYYLIFYKHKKRLGHQQITRFHNKGMEIYKMLKEETDFL